VEKTNSKAITSLILGSLSIFIPIIGLIGAIVGVVISNKAIKEINNLKEKGMGLAISGMILSILGICIHLLFILAMISYYSVKASN